MLLKLWHCFFFFDKTAWNFAQILLKLHKHCSWVHMFLHLWFFDTTLFSAHVKRVGVFRMQNLFSHISAWIIYIALANIQDSSYSDLIQIYNFSIHIFFLNLVLCLANLKRIFFYLLLHEIWFKLTTRKNVMCLLWQHELAE